jgi:hypothetical protein
MSPTLSIAEMEQPRTQAELRAWVDDVHERFGRTEEGKRAMRLKEGRLVKKFMEEIWPLALFADAFYPGAAEVLFKAVIGSQSYDALMIRSTPQRTEEYLQITQAIDGYQNHLRALHLTQYGRAPRTSELKKERGAQHVAETWGDAVPHQDALMKTLEEIKTAALKKSKMGYEKGTALIVEFDDWCIHSGADRGALNDWTRRELAAAAPNFLNIYLVSDRGRLAFQSRS